MPVKETLKLTAGDELRAEYFLERREIGVINIGGTGIITIDGKEYTVEHKQGMYIGKGSREISFASVNADAPAKFYLNSAPAHMTYPTVLIKREGTPKEGVVIVKDENKVELPGVICGHVEDALDAYTFAQINDGNAISLPFAKGYGWGGDPNLDFSADDPVL